MGILAAFAVTVVVELFTSEGCSSCPPADQFLQKLIDSQPIENVHIVALGEHVDYWDQLGWKDRFSSSAFTARQQTYGARFGIASVYTPQMVVDGRTEFVATDAAAARKALQRATEAAHGSIAIDATSVGGAVQLRLTADRLPSFAGDRADIVIAVTEDHLQTNVKRGENEGRVLAHAAVVRHLATVAEASASGPTTAAATIPIGADWRRDNLNIVAFVQARRGRAILASATVKAPR